MANGAAPYSKNRTRYKSLDKIVSDPRVEEIWDEGDDGIWVALTPGFQWEEVHCVHEWSVKDVLASFRSVEPCSCEGCRPLEHQVKEKDAQIKALADALEAVKRRGLAADDVYEQVNAALRLAGRLS